MTITNNINLPMSIRLTEKWTRHIKRSLIHIPLPSLTTTTTTLPHQRLHPLPKSLIILQLPYFLLTPLIPKSRIRLPLKHHLRPINPLPPRIPTRTLDTLCTLVDHILPERSLFTC